MLYYTSLDAVIRARASTRWVHGGDEVSRRASTRDVRLRLHNLLDLRLLPIVTPLSPIVRLPPSISPPSPCSPSPVSTGSSSPASSSATVRTSCTGYEQTLFVPRERVHERMFLQYLVFLLLLARASVTTRKGGKRDVQIVPT